MDSSAYPNEAHDYAEALMVFTRVFPSLTFFLFTLASASGMNADRVSGCEGDREAHCTVKLEKEKTNMKDLAILLENRPGALAEIGEALGRAGVSIEGGGTSRRWRRRRHPLPL